MLHLPCHWAPQCYGCHVKIDYSGGKQNPDYLAASHSHHNGVTGDHKNLKDFLVDGKVTETRSYLRWEDPALAQNGEGRVSPVIPGCQVILTVIGKDGKPSMPWLADTVLKDSTIKAHEKRVIRYPKSLQIGDSVTVELGYYIANPKVAKKLQIEDKALTEFIPLTKERFTQISK